MNESCAICRKPAVRPFEVMSGEVIGHVCDSKECGSLLWESHLNTKMPGGLSAEDSAWLSWRIARARGIQLRQPQMLDPSQKVAALPELRLLREGGKE